MSRTIYNKVAVKAPMLFHPTNWRNRCVYGPDSPRFGETIFIDPRAVKGILIPRCKDMSGTVVTDFPPTAEHSVIPIEQHGKISCCLEKWNKGIDWSETKYLREQLAQKRYQHGRTPEEQNQHWHKYDVLLEEIRREGRLRSGKELNRAGSGVLIHIGKGGALYQGDSGNRRFAASLFAGLTEIPAKVGCVHMDALDTFSRLRYPRNKIY